MWIVYALGASMLWGLTYILGEQIYKKISISTSLAITCAGTVIAMLVLAVSRGVLKKDVAAIVASPTLRNLVIAETVVFVLAEICIALSISTKNATLAGLVEISYPVFIAVFAYLLFNEKSIDMATFAGAFLIFSGIYVIYHFHV